VTRRASAAVHLVDALMAQGATHAFCVPGESYLAVLDAFVDAGGVRLITCRHEAAAANMAEAHGKLSGRPGLCFVTRGPGATHAAIGVHTAFQDSTPMILFVGQVARADRDREGFQELNYRAVFGGIAKWVAEIDQAERIGEYVARAFRVALQGRRGPVVLALPEDMLTDVVEMAAPALVEPARSADPALTGHVAAELARARRPLVLLGGTGWTAEGVAAAERFLDRHDIPAGTSFRSKDLLDNRHRCYAGDVGLGINPRLEARIAEADVILAIGTRLGENTTGGYTRLAVPRPKQQLVHIHPGAEELGRVYQPDVASLCDLNAAAEALSGLPAPDRAVWADWRAAARADYESWVQPHADGAGLNLSRIFAELDAAMGPETIFANGAGNYAAWLHRYVQHRPGLGAIWKTQLGPASGAMGYGVPAAIAAKIVCPARDVIAVSGDGCFLMASNELATAVHERAAVLFLVVNNSQYGTIRMHQERDYPGRVSATGLTNPDFVAYAQSFGLKAWRVQAAQDFASVLADALATTRSGQPALIELVTSPRDISPGRSLSA
jgi:acetolactate synthase-1/2/3 large subunit